MRVAKQISDNNLAAAQMNQMNAMNWACGRLGWRRRLPLLMGWLRARGSPGPAIPAPTWKDVRLAELRRGSDRRT
jgi:hypothetical protein